MYSRVLDVFIARRFGGWAVAWKEWARPLLQLFHNCLCPPSTVSVPHPAPGLIRARVWARTHGCRAVTAAWFLQRWVARSGRTFLGVHTLMAKGATMKGRASNLQRSTPLREEKTEPRRRLPLRGMSLSGSWRRARSKASCPHVSTGEMKSPKETVSGELGGRWGCQGTCGTASEML